MTKRFAAEIHGAMNSNNQEVNFEKSDIDEKLVIVTNSQSIIFSNSKFGESIMISTSRANRIFNFFGCVFKEVITIEGDEDVSIDFRNSTFEKGIRISGKGWLYLDFSNCKFDSLVRIGYCKLSTIIFDECVFLGLDKESLFYFEGNDVIDASFKSVKHINNCFFSKSVFQKPLSFKNSMFVGESNFSNTEFKGDCDFDEVSFGEFVLFSGAKFGGDVSFVGANTCCECDGNFSGAKFLGRAYFNHSAFTCLTLIDSDFHDVSSFQLAIIDKLEMKRVVFQKSSDFLNAVIKDADRETYRIIKNEFSNINNNVEVLHYRAKEMHAYEKELDFRKKPWEWFLVNLNRISNNHGLSWERGLFFTFFVSLVFYSFYLFSLGDSLFNWGFISWTNYWQTVNDTVKYYIRFFIITHDLDFMSIYKPTALSFIIDFLGKVFIGYGIYQTVQSFRKHGKG